MKSCRKIIRHLLGPILSCGLIASASAQSPRAADKIAVIGVAIGDKRPNSALIKDLQTQGQRFYYVGKEIPGVGTITNINRRGITISNGKTSESLLVTTSSSNSSSPNYSNSNHSNAVAPPPPSSYSGPMDSSAFSPPSDPRSNPANPGPVNPPMGGGGLPPQQPSASPSKGTSQNAVKPAATTTTSESPKSSPKIISLAQQQGPLFGDHLLKIKLANIPENKKVEIFLDRKLCINLQIINLTDATCYTPSTDFAHKVDMSLSVEGQRVDTYPLAYEYSSSENLIYIAANEQISNRSFAATAFENDNIYFWGGESATHIPYEQGLVYKTASDEWETMSTAGQPPPASGAVAVSTRKELIVWGGSTPVATNRGGRYDFLSKIWKPMNIAGAPSPRTFATAVWTGNKMIVWGGEINQNGMQLRLNTGGIYDPAKDSWATMAPSPAEIAGRSHHFAFWDGKEMKVWAGYVGGIGSTSGYFGAYNPETNVWTKISANNDYSIFNRDLGWAWFTGTKWMAQAAVSVELFNQSSPRFFDSETGKWKTLEGSSLPEILFYNSRRPQAIWSGRYLYIFKGDGSGIRYSFP